MARVSRQSHDPDSLGVPHTNIVDLRGSIQAEPVQAAPAPLLKTAAPTPKNNQPHARSWPRLKLPVMNRDLFEQWWWQVDLRNVAVFGILAVIVIGGLAGAQAYGALRHTQGVVLGASTDAYGHLRTAQEAINQDTLESAAAEFRAAKESFEQAAAQVDSLPGWLTAIIRHIPGPGTTVRSGEHLLAAGTDVATAGEAIIRVIQQFQTEREQQPAPLANQETTVTLLPVLDALEGDLATALTAAQHASDELAAISVTSVPQAYRSQVALVQQALPAARQELNSINSVVSLLKAILGSQTTKEYVLIFQNNNEVRATGGFIGSLAQIAVHDGTLRVVEVPGKGAYEINDDFDLKIVPPRPLWLINNAWQIQDANWWPDWPTSAAKLVWFYQTARGFPISGVVSLTPDVLIDLLRVTGPVDLTKTYGLTVTADNFLTTVQDISYNQQENRPKAIIADLMPIVISRLLNTNAKQLVETLTAVNQSLATKQMLMYFTDPQVEALVQTLGWAGEIRKTSDDFLSVIHTNIGGGKTDLVMATDVEHKAEIQSDGSIIDTVTIVRRHQGNPANELEKVKNMDYVRIYVPAGATLLEASGFSEIDSGLLKFPAADAVADDDLERLDGSVVVHEASGTRVYQQFDKTVFANWLGVEVGGTALATVRYRLPFSLKDNTYQVLLQKQSGTRGGPITSTLSWPAGLYQVSQVAPEQGVTQTPESITFSTELRTDRAWGARLNSQQKH